MDSYYEMSDRVYEWNNGVLEEKPRSDYLSFKMYEWFSSLLREYLEAHPDGEPVGLGIGFRMALPEKAVIRKPDLALILKDNPTPMELDEIIYKGVFDVCFEFLSDAEPWEVERDTVTKKTEYCRSGVREYFILDRKGRETAFYHLSGGAYAPIMPTPDGVIRSRVLPGFQFREEDLYTRPAWDKMAGDPVYSSFVRRAYQRERRDREEAEKQVRQERQRAETGRQRAEIAEQQAREERLETEKERQRAEIAEQQAREERLETEKERQRAEKLAAMLRDLGIEAD